MRLFSCLVLPVPGLRECLHCSPSFWFFSWSGERLDDYFVSLLVWGQRKGGDGSSKRMEVVQLACQRDDDAAIFAESGGCHHSVEVAIHRCWIDFWSNECLDVRRAVFVLDTDGDGNLAMVIAADN